MDRLLRTSKRATGALSTSKSLSGIAYEKLEVGNLSRKNVPSTLDVAIFVTVSGLLFLMLVCATLLSYAIFSNLFFAYYHVTSALLIVSILMTILAWVIYTMKAKQLRAHYPHIHTAGLVFNVLSALLLVAAGVVWIVAVHASRFPFRIIHRDSSRLGHVSTTEAHLLVTHQTTATQGTIAYQSEDNDPEQISRFNPAGGTGVVHLTGLAPGKRYTYFIDAGGIRSRGQFRTQKPANEARADLLTFITGSCFYPVPTRSRGYPDIWGEAGMPVDYALFLGDIMYASAAYTMTQNDEKYRDTYDAFHSHPMVLDKLTQIPTYFQFNNHELVAGWNRGNDDPFYKSKMAFYDQFFHATNPHTHKDRFYYTFEWHGISTFVCDVRSYLNNTAAAHEEGYNTVLGSEQMAALKTWFDASTGFVRFIASPVAVALNSSDSWGASNADERDGLVDYISKADKGLTFFLSGDTHYPFIQKLGSNVYEVSSSPFMGASSQPSDDEASAMEWYLGSGTSFASRFESVVTRVVVEQVPQCITVIVYKYRPEGSEQTFANRYCL